MSSEAWGAFGGVLTLLGAWLTYVYGPTVKGRLAERAHARGGWQIAIEALQQQVTAAKASAASAEARAVSAEERAAAAEAHADRLQTELVTMRAQVDELHALRDLIDVKDRTIASLRARNDRLQQRISLLEAEWPPERPIPAST